LAAAAAGAAAGAPVIGLAFSVPMLGLIGWLGATGAASGAIVRVSPVEVIVSEARSSGFPHADGPAFNPVEIVPPEFGRAGFTTEGDGLAEVPAGAVVLPASGAFAYWLPAGSG